jgi:hypothetical protein
VANPVAVVSGLLVPVVCPASRETLLALSPTATASRSLARSDDVRVLDARSGREVTRCAGFQQVLGIELLSAEGLLVTAVHGCFRCDLRRGRRAVLSAEAWPTCTAVSPNGRVVAIGVQGGGDLYDVRKGRVSHRLNTAFTYRPIGTRAAFSAGGRYVAAELSDENYQSILVGVWETHRSQCANNHQKRIASQARIT